ncbi:pectinesterase inhibitor-like [Salvia miltiorrhiza]|uniref:pectinesterase inhibitor-like n=1 Tax=Salvia miltiorrhiza TaxID=226208 RepID=UPI0025ACD9F8|nr:pectinesterase inhibitor-like [Salvia miltiorrhiza]
MSSFAIIFVSLALLSQCKADLIGDFCKKSNNPSLCSKTLSSDPRSKAANARALAEIALENAVSATQASIRVAKSVANPGNKAIIDTCVETFGDAVETLQECKPLIPKQDRPSIDTLRTKGSAALTDVDTCSDEFGAKEPSQLKQASDKAYTFVQLLLIIANTL